MLEICESVHKDIQALESRRKIAEDGGIRQMVLVLPDSWILEGGQEKATDPSALIQAVLYE
jgi:hypothetical protein